MAEQSLSELVMNLINWVESLHENNLKYEAQVEKLSRDLAQAQNSNAELEARLSAYHESTTVPMNMTPTIHPQQPMYQPIAPQPAPYVWTYDPNGHYDQYGTQAYHQP